MLIRIVLIFLTVMIALALLTGPAFRRWLWQKFGLGRRDK